MLLHCRPEKAKGIGRKESRPQIVAGGASSRRSIHMAKRICLCLYFYKFENSIRISVISTLSYLYWWVCMWLPGTKNSTQMWRRFTQIALGRSLRRTIRVHTLLSQGRYSKTTHELRIKKHSRSNISWTQISIRTTIPNPPGHEQETANCEKGSYDKTAKRKLCNEE